MRRTIIGLAALAAMAMPAHAQQKIEWKTVAASPAGLGLPAGVAPAILGIKPGDTYAAVRALADEIVKEDRNYDYYVKEKSVVGQLIREGDVRFNIPIPGGGSINAEFKGKLEIRRNQKGAGQEAIYDNIDVYFSAPSSGHQVIGVRRSVLYHNVKDQPQISAVVAALKEMLKSDAKPIRTGEGQAIGFLYDDGKTVPVPGAIDQACQSHRAAINLIQQDQIQYLNPKGNCDVAFSARFRKGVTEDHVFEMIFELSDNERAKRNATTDYKFFSDYVTSLASKPRAVPKL